MKKLLILFLVLCSLFVNVGVSAATDPSGLVSSVQYDDVNEEITVICDETYMSKITGFKLDDWNCAIDDGGIFPDGRGKTSTSFTFPSRNALGDRTGTFTLIIYADGYDNYSCTVTIGNPAANYPADLQIEVNDDGDLIIFSKDVDYMSELVSSYKEEEHEVLEGIVHSTTKQGNLDYYFGVHNCFGEGVRDFEPLKYDEENNIVVFSVADQKNIDLSQVYRGQLLNDVNYEINLTVRGYDTYVAPGTYLFPKSNIRIPTNEVGVYVTDGYLIVKASDDDIAQDFLNNIYYAAVAEFDSDDLVVDGTLVGSADLISVDDFDTIDEKHDRVYRLYDDIPQDLTNYKGIINSNGYGQYCWDGRPFGGEVYVKAQKFDVTLKDNGGKDQTTEELGEFVLPGINPTNGKEIVGWQVESKGQSVYRCVGEVVFITSDTVIYAIYKDSPTPERIDPKLIINAANEIKIIDVDDNVYNTKLSNSSFVSESEAERGVSIWVEVKACDTDDEKNQLNWALNKNSYDEVEVLDVFDANVYKKVGESDFEKVAETEDYVELVLDLSNASDDILELANNGKLGIVSVHDGVFQKPVGGSFDAKTQLFTIRVNKFSTFGFVEAEGEVVNKDTSHNSSFNVPRTGI